MTTNVTTTSREPLATDKHDLGFRWAVTGEHGTVAYENFGNRLALLDTNGDLIDVTGKRWADRVREYAELGDDDAVYEVLADHYRTQLAGGAR